MLTLSSFHTISPSDCRQIPLTNNPNFKQTRLGHTLSKHSFNNEISLFLNRIKWWFVTKKTPDRANMRLRCIAKFEWDSDQHSSLLMLRLANHSWTRPYSTSLDSRQQSGQMNRDYNWKANLVLKISQTKWDMSKLKGTSITALLQAVTQCPFEDKCWRR